MTITAKPVFDWALLYVADPLKSADFYEKILGVPATDRAPTFSMFALANGMKLGLWLKDDVLPAATTPGGIELSFTEADRDADRGGLCRRSGRDDEGGREHAREGAGDRELGVPLRVSAAAGGQ